MQCRCRDMELVCVLLLCLCPACVCQVPRACSESDGVLQAPVCSVSTELPSPSPHSSADRTKSVSDGPMVSLGTSPFGREGEGPQIHQTHGGSLRTKWPTEWPHPSLSGTRGCGEWRSVMLIQCEVYTQRQDCYCEANLWVSLMTWPRLRGWYSDVTDLLTRSSHWRPWPGSFSSSLSATLCSTESTNELTEDTIISSFLFV